MTEPSRAWMYDQGYAERTDGFAGEAMAALMRMPIPQQPGLPFCDAVAQLAYDYAEAMMVEKYARKARAMRGEV
jgi:hypothetical protein